MSIVMKAGQLALLLAPALACAATQVVTIEGMQFQPATVTVKAGDQVVWHNQDLVPHTVTAAGQFDSKSMAPGKSWSWTATGKGRHDYACTFHPTMKGSVVVQ